MSIQAISKIVLVEDSFTLVIDVYQTNNKNKQPERHIIEGFIPCVDGRYRVYWVREDAKRQKERHESSESYATHEEAIPALTSTFLELLSGFVPYEGSLLADLALKAQEREEQSHVGS